ncbi:TPA: hypothetical protein WH483_000691 [Neisseria meningitidis]
MTYRILVLVTREVCEPRSWTVKTRIIQANAFRRHLNAKRLPCAKAVSFSSAVRTGAAVGNIFFDGFADGGDFGDGAQYGFATFNAVDAASDSAGGIAGAAVLEIVEDEDFEGDLGSWADSVKMVRSSDGITVVPMPSETAAVQAFVPDGKIGYNIGHQCPTY